MSLDSVCVAFVCFALGFHIVGHWFSRIHETQGYLLDWLNVLQLC